MQTCERAGRRVFTPAAAAGREHTMSPRLGSPAPAGLLCTQSVVSRILKTKLHLPETSLEKRAASCAASKYSLFKHTRGARRARAVHTLKTFHSRPLFLYPPPSSVSRCRYRRRGNGLRVPVSETRISRLLPRASVNDAPVPSSGKVRGKAAKENATSASVRENLSFVHGERKRCFVNRIGRQRHNWSKSFFLFDSRPLKLIH